MLLEGINNKCLEADKKGYGCNLIIGYSPLHWNGGINSS